MKPETLVVACGIFNAAIGVFHLCFWRLFRWREVLTRIDRPNGATLQVLNIMLTYLLFTVAVMQLW